jgi:hypothetical protein
VPDTRQAADGVEAPRVAPMADPGTRGYVVFGGFGDEPLPPEPPPHEEPPPPDDGVGPTGGPTTTVNPITEH